MAEKSNPGTRQTDGKTWFGLVWENREKNNQIVIAYLYLQFFLLIILRITLSTPLLFWLDNSHSTFNYADVRIKQQRLVLQDLILSYKHQI